MKKKLLAAWLTGAMALAANAIPSWSPTWHDANYGGETFDRVEFFIINGGSSAATFTDVPTVSFDNGTPGWVGAYVNPTYTYISGTPVTLSGAVGDMMSLYFSGARPPQNDIRLDVLYWNGSTLVNDLCWRWLNLPNYGYAGGIQWDYIPNLDPNTYNRSLGEPSPGLDPNFVEHVLPTTLQDPATPQVPDAGATGLLLGFGLMALGCLRRAVPAAMTA